MMNDFNEDFKGGIEVGVNEINELTNEKEDSKSKNTSFSKKTKKPKVKESKEPKVKDLIFLLDHCGEIANSPFFEGSQEQFAHLKKVKIALNRFKNESLSNFVDMIEKLDFNKEIQDSLELKELNLEEILSLSYQEIKTLCENYDQINKNSLDRIGHERFGISLSQLKSSSKDKTVRLLLTSLENLDILDSIAAKAKSLG